jgi:hypothetical protein
MGRLFLREHRIACGVSANDMAKRMGFTREYLYRFEQEPQVNSERQLQWSKALGYADPDVLWSPPGAPRRPDLNALVKDQPTEVVEKIEQLIRLLIKLLKR